MPTHKWSEIRDTIYADPERKRRIEQGMARLEAELALAQVRRARKLTQVQLAAAMGKPQSTISRIEKQVDLYLSTLRSYVEAMGATLEITAVFPDQRVPVTNLGNLGRTPLDGMLQLDADFVDDAPPKGPDAPGVPTPAPETPQAPRAVAARSI